MVSGRGEGTIAEEFSAPEPAVASISLGGSLRCSVVVEMAPGARTASGAFEARKKGRIGFSAYKYGKQTMLIRNVNT